MLDILTYRPPAKVDTSKANEASGASCSVDGNCCDGIPDKLTFERIMNGATCPPMTSRDFMDYLIYVEHGAENLQFYLWYKDYSSRFNDLPESEKVLSPPYSGASDGPEVAKPPAVLQKPNPNIPQFFKSNSGKDDQDQETHHLVSMSSMQTMRTDPFSTPPATPNDSMFPGSSITPFDGTMNEIVLDHQRVTAEAFAEANVPQPFTIQPFRKEMSRVIAVYLVKGAPRELNLSANDRAKAIKAVAQTTHPSALEHVNRHIEDLLRFQSHPNFVRWSIRNGNPIRVFMARTIGCLIILMGFIVAILITLGSKPRGYRAFAAIPWFLGIATLWSAYRGMCVILHGWRRRHVRPWELWSDESEKGSKISFELDEKPNSYEDEPWVKKYKKRFFVRKVFDRQVYIQDPALRELQDAVAIQGACLALTGTLVLTAVFLVLPHGHYF